MPRCRVCGCTEENACNPSCCWAEDDLCSSCGEAIDAVVLWMEAAVRANFTGLLREARVQYAADALLTLPARRTAPRGQKKRTK